MSTHPISIVSQADFISAGHKYSTYYVHCCSWILSTCIWIPVNFRLIWIIFNVFYLILQLNVKLGCNICNFNTTF